MAGRLIEPELWARVLPSQLGGKDGGSGYQIRTGKVAFQPGPRAKELGVFGGRLSGVEMPGPELRLGGSPSARPPCGACQEGLL